nr:hypothetical protein [Planococcus salinarum]
MDIRKALHAGLKFRSLEETIRDTLAWESTRTPHERKAGLDPQKEKAVLYDWTEKGL